MSNSSFFEPKSVLFREGEEASKLYLIKTGEVLCLKYSNERLIPVFLGKAEDIIGESAMLEGAPYTYSAIAISRTEVISIPNKDFIQTLSVAPKWLVDLTLTMVSRFQNTAGLVAENRVIHSSILSEEQFPSALEIEYKRLLSQ
jgi:CRP-like cAMP-binding protein